MPSAARPKYGGSCDSIAFHASIASVAAVAREPLAAQQVRAHALAVGLERCRRYELGGLARAVDLLGDRELAVVVGDFLLVVALARSPRASCAAPIAFSQSFSWM
jgi:hypothetical protein